MSRYSQTRRAQIENAIARFLVDWCLEEEGLEVRGTDLHEAFGIWWRVQNRKSHIAKQVHENVYLDIQQMYRLLEEAQFQKETRQELGPRGRPKAVVWWLGLGVDQAKYLAGRELVEPPRERPKAPPAPEPQAPPEPKAPERISIPATPGSSHVVIKGTVYSKALIATVTPMRKGFKHWSTGETVAYVVTFVNPELGRQYVTQAEGDRLRKELGLE